MKHRTLMLTGVAVLSASLALVACSEAPAPNANLNAARQTCQAAASDPVVQKSAPNELLNGKEELDAAQKAWSDNNDKAEVDHLAYMSHRYCEIAVQAAKVRTNAIAATTTARVVTLGDMLFASGKSDLNSEGMKAVGDLATFMHNYPDRTIAIAGYTDSVGSVKMNEALSQRRAAAVQNALIAQGVAANRITAQGLGEANPVASNGTEAGRRQNRRVEVAISGQPNVGVSSK